MTLIKLQFYILPRMGWKMIMNDECEGIWKETFGIDLEAQ